jgi:hypothetical protein
MAQQAKFFEYSQNNSGGSFDIDDAKGIGPRVWIEARDAQEADSLAGRLGIYFDGCESGLDCSCCGDRWSSAWGEGSAEPEISQEYDFNWHDTVYLHRLDGSVERIKRASSAEA